MAFSLIKDLTPEECNAQRLATYFNNLSGFDNSLNRKIVKLNKDITNCEKGLAAFAMNNNHYRKEAMVKTTANVVLVAGLAWATAKFVSVASFCMSLPIVPYFVGADLTICVVGISPLALGAIVTACALFSVIAIRESFNLIKEAKLALEEAPVKHETEGVRLAMLQEFKMAHEFVQRWWGPRFERPVVA